VNVFHYSFQGATAFRHERTQASLALPSSLSVLLHERSINVFDRL
jgi:hypothetical protein